ncbi:MAG: glycosyltransferase family 2 protein [Patescibacteria group bacterium]|nr:glycosyltransferase family 2 protein [Patescibacteria group bacterium]
MILSVIIPVFNEEKTIKEIVKRVLAEKTPKEVIIVDDGSTDGTLKIVKSLKLKVESNNLRLKVILNKKNMGKGAAVRKGMAAATGDILIIQDADLEYDPRDYPKLISPIIKEEARVVYGTRLQTLPLRFLGKGKTPMPLHYLANFFLSKLTNFLYGGNLTDIETCYKVMAREVYQSLELQANCFDFEPEITAKILHQGFKIVEVPIVTQPRSYQEGKKIKARDAVIAIWTLLKYRIVLKWSIWK